MNRVNKMLGILATSSVLLAGCASAPNEQNTGVNETGHHVSHAQMTQMHGELQKMQDQMSKIHATQDPVERQRLMAEERGGKDSEMEEKEGKKENGLLPMKGGEGGGPSMGKGGMKDEMMHGQKDGAMGKDSAQQCPMMEQMKMMRAMMGQ